MPRRGEINVAGQGVPTLVAAFSQCVSVQGIPILLEQSMFNSIFCRHTPEIDSPIACAQLIPQPRFYL